MHTDKPKDIYYNGGIAAAEQQIIDNGYLEPFRGGKRMVVGLAVELDSEGKGLVD